MSDPELAIVLPVYNEGEAVEPVLRALAAAVRTPHEIVVVYDFDGDTTVPVIERLAAELPGLRGLRNDLGRGVLNAMRAGIAGTSAPYVLISMADGSDEPAVVDRMVALAREGADVVSASRYMRGGQQVGGPRLKRLLSRAAGLTLHAVAGVATHDPTNNFKLYARRFLDAVTIESTAGFELALELTVKATLLGRRVAEVPTTWRDRTAGESRFRLRAWLPHYLRWFRVGLLGRNPARTLGRIGVLLAGLAVAIGVRALLLPRPGLAGDLDLFVGWAQWIAQAGLGRAYEQPISFPPVLPWIWAGLSVVDSGLRTAPLGDPMVNVLMKLPATLADFGLAATVGWWLRARPAWAVAAALAILLAPIVVYVSAWWGQFESIYVLPALLATVLASRRRLDAAAVFAAVALMTKPQALPLMVPLAAWFFAIAGWKGIARAAAVGALVVFVLWLPFLADGGVAAYVGNLGHYANEEYEVISLRAWNPWWLAQLAAPTQDFVVDGVRLLGPISFRTLGIVATGALLLLVAVRIVRRPTPTALAWGMAASALVAFTALTTMHERYSYPALAFLLLLWPSRFAIAGWLVLLVAASANVIAAVPPEGGPGALLPLDGPIAILGVSAIAVVNVGSLIGLVRATAAPRPAFAGRPVEPRLEVA